MDWKNFVLMILGALLPVVYVTWLVDLNIPLSQEQFVATVIWLLGLIFGWNFKSIRVKKAIKQATGKTYEQLIQSKR